LQLLVAHPGSLEFAKDSGEVKRDKPVGLEQVEKLIEKVVGIVFNEILKIVNGTIFEGTKAPRKALIFRDNISCFAPELENTEPRLAREVTAIQDIFYIEEMTFIQFYSRNLDVATDFAGH
jgi:hypothetical protein